MIGRIARSYLVPIAVVLAAALATAGYRTARAPRVYRASASLVVSPAASVEGTGDILRSLDTLERRSVIATFARIPSAPAGRGAAARTLGLAEGEAARYAVEGSVVPNTNILRIDVEGPDPARTAALANAVAAATASEVGALYRIYELRPLAPAVEPRRPVHPNPQRNYAVAAILGLLLGGACGFLLDRGRAAAG